MFRVYYLLLFFVIQVSFASQNNITISLDRINDVNSENGCTRLHYAVFENNLAHVDWLLRNNVRTNTYDNNGFLAVHYIKNQRILDAISDFNEGLITQTVTRDGVKMLEILMTLNRTEGLNLDFMKYTKNLYS